MALYRDETFGPVVAIYSVDGDDAAVTALANDTEYGLNAKRVEPRRRSRPRGRGPHRRRDGQHQRGLRRPPTVRRGPRRWAA